MEYLTWNDLIAKYFFNEEMAGREVLLYINEELIKTLGSDYGVDKADFIEAVKNGPPGISGSGLCQKAMRSYLNWRSKNLDYPPYIGYLAFFVLAAGFGTEFAPQAYYPRFWTLLGESPYNGTPRHFERMISLWGDLEKWSREDKKEDWGRFVARIRGKWWKVGLPLSQTLISEKERKLLPVLFEAEDLDPTDMPSPKIMEKLIKKHEGEIFQRRTIRILESKTDDGIVFKDALTRIVLQELEDWEGTEEEEEEPQAAEESATAKPRRERRTQAGLRICLHLIGDVAESYVRFKTNKPFPEEGLLFKRLATGEQCQCTEAYQGWSTALKILNEEGTAKLSGDVLDWNNGEQFVDEENRWRTKLRSASTRVFREGLDSLKDWVEVQHVEQGTEYLIACTGDDIQKVESWGKEFCGQITTKNFRGLPSGWRLFLCRNISASCPGIDILTISDNARISLCGGIKTNNRASTYFEFAPPVIVIENGTGEETIEIDGVRQPPPDGKQEWKLPGGISPGLPVRIEGYRGDDRFDSKTVTLSAFTMAESFSSTPVRDNQGSLHDLDGARPSSQGAAVLHFDVIGNYPYQLPFHLSERIVFIGRMPGQIAAWPGALPPDWESVWALAQISRNKWEAHFCGRAEDIESLSQPGEPCNDRQARKRWKEALYINRRITDGPQLGVLKKIWKTYSEAAQRV